MYEQNYKLWNKISFYSIDIDIWVNFLLIKKYWVIDQYIGARKASFSQHYLLVDKINTTKRFSLPFQFDFDYILSGNTD